MAALAPISLASTIIGFISFALTVLIWLHSFWSWYETVVSAPAQIRDQLATLRQSLYEEREHVRRIRRRKLGGYEKRGSSDAIYFDGGPVKVIGDAVRDLIHDFKRLERPFLIPPHGGREKDLEWSFNATQGYYRCDFGHRFKWLQNKSGVVNVAQRLQALQVRRIAVEVTENHVMVAQAVSMIRGSDERLSAIEERLRMSHIN
ncbi:MAG: hypothetical protein M1818_007962 [Claussenomyces sp. TS43310]|nr:MAG: hypothetical protein M1818_007962 [Claussenomyces sp. TS43310]